MHIAFASDNDLYVQDAGGGQPVALVRNAHQKRPSDWSRDGKALVFSDNDPSTQSDIWMLSDPLGSGPKRAVPVIQTPSIESQGKLSPDSRWIAYSSDESGQLEVYVRPFPSGPGKWRISANGGREPSWRGDGKELFYVEPRGTGYRIVAVSIAIAASGEFEPGRAMPLFDFPAVGTIVQGNVYTYGATHDGSRFLVHAQVTGIQQEVHVITNWRPTITTTTR